MELTPTHASHNTRRDLVITAAEAARLIPSGGRLAVGGSGSLLQVPESILAAVEDEFAQTRQPAAIEVLHTMGLGDRDGRGLDHLALPGLVRRFVGSHFVLSPRQQKLITDNLVEAVALPAGTLSLLYREIAAGRPGLFTDIGLGTFVDPRHQWGRMNDSTITGLSEVMVLRGREWLFYPTFPIDAALIRATEADSDGNVTMEDEAALSDNLAIAQAAHNSGGIVIVEVKRVSPAGSLPAARVRIPGILVDHVVVTDHPKQTPITVHDPRRTGTEPNRPIDVEPLPLDVRKVVARRAAMELSVGDLANLGVGMANGVSYVALEEGILDRITLTVEQGLFGGLPGVGMDSGTAINPSAMVDMSSQFDLYDGGALDFAGLGFAQVDRLGNVNVAQVDGVPIGPGGFIDISQKASTVIFCGTFTGGGQVVDVGPDGLRIRTEGAYSKFVDELEWVAFSADRARATRQRVLYVTERAVFGLHPEGVELLEVAPGIDVERDVLARMSFEPLMPMPPRLMDSRIFTDAPMGWRPGSRTRTTTRAATREMGAVL